MQTYYEKREPGRKGTPETYRGSIEVWLNTKLHIERFCKSWKKLSEVSELNGYSRDYAELEVEAVTIQSGEILLNTSGT